MGKLSVKGGFELQTKHDYLTALVSIALLAAFVVLDITNHLTGQTTTGFLTAMGAFATYWFTRGGSLIQSNPTATPSTSTPSVDPAVVSAVVDALGKQSAVSVPASSGQVKN